MDIDHAAYEDSCPDSAILIAKTTVKNQLWGEFGESLFCDENKIQQYFENIGGIQ